MTVSGSGSPMVRSESELKSGPAMPHRGPEPDRLGQAARATFLCWPQGRRCMYHRAMRDRLPS